MSISDLGAIGELVGALAVLATLIYLAIQARATRQATDLQTFTTLSGHGAQTAMTMAASSPDALRVWVSNIKGEELTGDDLLIYGVLQNAMAVNSFVSVLHATDSPTKAQAIAGYEAVIRGLWDDQNFIKLWEGGFWSFLIEEQRAVIESYRPAQ